MEIHKKISFVIINSQSDPHALAITHKTLIKNFPESDVRCVLPKKHFDKKILQKICPCDSGATTITGLLDLGLKKSKKELTFFILAGIHVKPFILKKYENFYKSNKDIMFPVVNRKWSFENGTINGLMIPTLAYKEVGSFGDGNTNLEAVKLLWAIDAIQKGYKFKGLVGARII